MSERCIQCGKYSGDDKYCSDNCINESNKTSKCHWCNDCFEPGDGYYGWFKDTNNDQFYKRIFCSLRHISRYEEDYTNKTHYVEVELPRIKSDNKQRRILQEALYEREQREEREREERERVIKRNKIEKDRTKSRLDSLISSIKKDKTNLNNLIELVAQMVYCYEKKHIKVFYSEKNLRSSLKLIMERLVF